MSQVASAQSTQYAMKKRKKPQPRNKNSPAVAQIKSNPSKRHRDRLNTELDRLSQLIPLPAEVVNKLDKLSILRLSVAYLRNKSYSKYLETEKQTEPNNALFSSPKNKMLPNDVMESDLALQALDGFIMVVTQNFNVFYITSNVQDCLGFPQSDIMYQCMLDLIHAEDRKLFMKQMKLNPQGPAPEAPPEDGDPPDVPEYVKHGLTTEMIKQLSQDGLLHRSFICRLRCLHDTSSGFLALHFTGHLGLVPGQNRQSENGTPLPPELGLFLLSSPLQTPSILEIRTKNYIFRTKHKLDYTPLGVDQKGRIVLGYTEQELRQQSGYQFIHSADMMHCADAHTKLMRKGQSGMTVFRLLHRANRWQWVTASARLVFSKGQPDYIISTHRPITDQEGEEHLKKRSSAFRFDFTGHATLYASINPIGAGPPPNNNQSYGSPEMKPHINSGGPTSKRARITNGHSEPDFDPATLFGAQSLQSMDNYKEGLPMIDSIKTTDSPLDPYPDLGIGVKTEPGQLSDDEYYVQRRGGNLLPKQPQNTPGSLSSASPENPLYSHMTSPGDSGYSDNEPHHLPNYNPDLPPLAESEPPPLHHPPISTNQQELPAYNEQYNHHYQSNGYLPHMLPETKYNHVEQPRPQPAIPSQVWHGNQPQAPADQMHHRQNYVGHQRPTMNGQYQSNNPNRYNHEAPRVPAAVESQPPILEPYDYKQPNQLFPRPTGYQAPTQSYNGTHDENGYLGNWKTTSQPKENVSVLNSLEISSVRTTARLGDRGKEMDDILGVCDSLLSDDVAGNAGVTLQYEEHTLQFDLDRIAAEYQTVNPYGVIQNYVQNNPQEAITIATGMMPEKETQPPNGIHGHMDQYTSCQYQNGHGINSQTNANYMPGMNHVQAANHINVKNEGNLLDEPECSLDDFIQFNIPSM